MLAPSLVLLVPASLLLATLYTLWQFTRTNQLVAMRACGLSIVRIMGPFLWIGVFAGVLITLLNETFVSDMAIWAKQFEDNRYSVKNTNVIRNIRYINNLDRRLWHIGVMDAMNPNVLKDVKITQERPDHSKIWEMSASKAEWLDEAWWFYNASRKDYREDGHPIGKETAIEGSQHGYGLPGLKEKPADMTASLKPDDYL
jgi:lipopolysaccharide export system permease protein